MHVRAYHRRVTVSLTSHDPARLAVDALVVAVAQQDGAPAVLGVERLPKDLRAQLASAAALGITGAPDEVRRLPGTGLTATVLVLTGVGPADKITPETLRRAAGAATRELAGTASVGLALPADDAESVAAVAEGALFGAYSYTRYRASEAAKQAPVGTIQIVTAHPRDRATLAAVARAEVVAAAVHGTRDLVNAAPNDLYPAAFAEAAKAAVKESGAKGLQDHRAGRQGARRRRLRRPDRRRSGLRARSPAGQGVVLAVARRRSRSRSSARGSRSTRAASRSSPPPAWRR